MKHYAAILANLGAPSSAEDVKPFLKSLFSDPDIFKFPGGRVGQVLFSSLIATLRAPKSRKIYKKIDGSPLVENTKLQAEALEKALASYGHYKIFSAQRYSEPSIQSVIEVLKKKQVDEILLLPLFPQYSTTTSGSFFNEWDRQGGADFATVKKNIHFYKNEKYLKVCVELIKKELATFSSPPHLLFSAHSLPKSIIKSGDPYQKEIEATLTLIMKQLPEISNYSLCYQSKVGPVKWLEPSVSQALHTLYLKGERELLVFPLSFVSEHLETLYELDIEYAALAKDIGFTRYQRASTPGTHPLFIEALKELVLEMSDE